MSVKVRDRLEQMREREFEALHFEMARVDEITDAAERLAAPMESSFEYSLGDENKLYFKNEAIDTVFINGIAEGERLVQQNPDFEFELRRRKLELAEYYDLVKFASINDPNGDFEDIMITISTIPDEVLLGTRINGYNRARRKTLVRVYEKIEGGVRATSLSLDLSDRDGLREIARLFNEDIRDDETSEEILARRFLAYSKNLKHSPAKTVRRVYDEVLEQKYGGNWYAGRQDDKIKNTYDFIVGQPGLVASHMCEISRIQALALSKASQEEMLEKARYNFAAALNEIMNGQTSAGDVDISSAGDRARADNLAFDRECPTGATSVVEAVNSMLGRKTFIDGTCRVCLAKSKVGECSVCLNCEKADNRGENLDKIHAIAKSRLRDRSRQSKANLNRKDSPRWGALLDTSGSSNANLQESREEVAIKAKQELIRKKYGKYAMMTTVITLGGTRATVIDSRTQQEIVQNMLL
jgi:hypothetical protein